MTLYRVLLSCSHIHVHLDGWSSPRQDAADESFNSIDRRENEERAAECQEMRERLALGSAELADVRRRAEAAAGELSRAEVRLRSAEAQKSSLAAEVAPLSSISRFFIFKLQSHLESWLLLNLAC